MSNIIRSRQTLPIEKKILQTRKIEYKNNFQLGQEIDPIQHKQYVLREIESLEAQREQLKSQLQHDQEKAKAEIDLWWQEIKLEAEKEAERLKEEATAQGFQTGLEQGKLQIEEELRQKRQDMQELVESAYEEKVQIVQESEPFLLALSVKIAEKVIRDELKQHEEQLLNVVKQALRHIEEAEDIVMQVSSEDYPVILPFLEELKTYVRADSELKMIPVASIEQGGCMLHTASGSYDVTIDSQLEEIKKNLLAYCEEKTNDEPAGR